MLAVGLGAAGLGVGELYSRPEIQQDQSVVGLTNKDLLQIVNNEKASPELVKAILEYAKVRDREPNQYSSHPSMAKKTTPVSFDYEEITIDPVKEAAVTAEESIVSLPMAWALIGMGIATSISGIAVFANRHNRRNTDDPNHPNFESQYKRA